MCKRKCMPNRAPPSFHGEKLEEIRHQAVLSSLTKFRFFFAGLIFAVLSYSIQKPVDSVSPYLNWAESISWLLLLASGLFAVKECGGFNLKLTEDAVFSGLSERYRKVMYGLFILAMLLLVLSRIGAKCT